MFCLSIATYSYLEKTSGQEMYHIYLPNNSTIKSQCSPSHRRQWRPGLTDNVPPPPSLIHIDEDRRCDGYNTLALVACTSTDGNCNPSGVSMHGHGYEYCSILQTRHTSSSPTRKSARLAKVAKIRAG
jgi:hypothetical protein